MMAKNNTNSDGSKAIQSCISSLGDELLVEILCRLGSSKYATQCKCICKRWFFLINSTNSRDSYFLRKWRKINLEDEAEKPIALLTQYRIKRVSYNYIGYENYHGIAYLSLHNKNLPTLKFLDFLPCYKSNNISIEIDATNPIFILASSKDLVLCCPNRDDHSVYYICNPFTKQWIILPPSPLRPLHNLDSVQVNFVVSDDDDDDLKFKVVRVFHDPSIGHELDKVGIKVETFSSDDNSCVWRMRSIIVPIYWSYLGVVSYDGKLVWMSPRPDLERIILVSDDHACANTDANYTLLSLPVGYKKRNKSSHIGVCMGCLRIGQLVDNISHLENYVPKLIIWELNRHSQDWELVHELDFCEVDLPDLPEGKYLGESNILAFHPRDGDILFLDFASSRSSMTCICNVRERTVEMIRDIPIKNWTTSKAFPLQMSSWPTPIPLLSLPPELEKLTLMDPDEPGSKSALVETRN